MALNFCCVYAFHVVFHCLHNGSIWSSISVCCVVCIVKYSLIRVSYLVVVDVK